MITRFYISLLAIITILVIVLLGLWGFEPGSHLLSDSTQMSDNEEAMRPPDLLVGVSLYPAQYPLRVSSNSRFLEDQSGAPFFLNADAAWSLIAQLTYDEASYYLANRVNRGFNGVLVNLIEHLFCTNAPNNIYNVPPFTGTPFITPNEQYFAHCDSVISKASDLGAVIFLAPVYLGYGCSSQGWCAEVQARSSADMKSWGSYIGNRFKDYANIVWVIGGDTDPTPVRTKLDSLVAGLRAADNVYPNRIMTTHNEPETQALSHWPGRSWLTLNSIYTYSNTLYNQAEAAYDVSPTKPFYMLESSYENERGSTPQTLRAQAYWSVLRGGCGHIFGNCPIWMFGYTSAWCGLTDWNSALNSAGSFSMSYFAALFNSRYWHKLFPDRSGSVITAGAQSGTSFATFAYSSDSSSIIGYLPTQRNVTINPSVLTGDSIQVWWYRPSNGVVSDAGIFGKTSRSYSQPSSGDWVMVIDSKSFNFNEPGNLGPILVSPPNTSTGVVISPNLVWHLTVGADTYTVQVASDVSFGNLVFTDSLLTDTTRQVSGLNNGTTYYWRVRGTNTQGNGPWSSSWSFTTVSLPPSAPVLIEPLDLSLGQPLSPILTWSRVFGADSYDVQLSSDPGFSSLILNDSLLVDTTQQASGLNNGAIYFWRVRSRNVAGLSGWTVPWSFTTTIQLPGQVQLVSPADEATLNSDTVSFVWHQSSPGITNYWIEGSTDSLFSQSLIDSTLTDTTTTVPGVPVNTTYYWRVKAKNSIGWGQFSSNRSFTVRVSAVSDPEVTIPSQIRLEQNYPNPFNPETIIRFSLPSFSDVTLDVFSIHGRKIATLASGRYSAGWHSVRWNGMTNQNVPASSGVYIYSLRTGTTTITKKLLLLR